MSSCRVSQWQSGIQMPVSLTSHPVFSPIKSQLFQSASWLCLHFPSILFFQTLSLYCLGYGWLMNSFVSEILRFYFAYGREKSLRDMLVMIMKRYRVRAAPAEISKSQSEQFYPPPLIKKTKKDVHGFTEVDSLQNERSFVSVAMVQLSCWRSLWGGLW